MSTVWSWPRVTVWWIITPWTGPQGPLLLRLWSRQLPSSMTVRPSALRAARKVLADMGGAMRASRQAEAPGRGWRGACLGSGEWASGASRRSEGGADEGDLEAQVGAGDDVVAGGAQRDGAVGADEEASVSGAGVPAAGDDVVGGPPTRRHRCDIQVADVAVGGADGAAGAGQVEIERRHPALPVAEEVLHGPAGHRGQAGRAGHERRLRGDPGAPVPDLEGVGVLEPRRHAFDGCGEGGAACGRGREPHDGAGDDAVGEGLRGVRDGRRVDSLSDLHALAVLVGRAHGHSSLAVGHVVKRPLATQLPLPYRPIRMRSPSAGVV